MKTQTFEYWYQEFTKILKDKHGFTEETIASMDKQSYKETYFNSGDTAEDAVNEELSYMN